MTLAFLVFYKIRALSNQEKEDAKREWEEFKAKLPADIQIIGEYEHAWGSVYNGVFILETDNMSSFLNWWPKFRDLTRWYVTETKTITCTKA